MIRSTLQAALAVALFASVAQSASAQVPNFQPPVQLPPPLLVNLNPDLGVNLSCPVGFTLTIAGTHASCKKQQTVNINAVCTNRAFQDFTVRGNEKDLCAKAGVNIPSVGSLAGLEPGRDFIDSTFNQADVTAAETSIEAVEPGKINARLISVDRQIDGASGSRDRFQAKFDVFHTVIVR